MSKGLQIFMYPMYCIYWKRGPCTIKFCQICAHFHSDEIPLDLKCTGSLNTIPQNVFFLNIVCAGKAD